MIRFVAARALTRSTVLDRVEVDGPPLIDVDTIKGRDVVVATSPAGRITLFVLARDDEEGVDAPGWDIVSVVPA